ncbi:MAG: DUF2163 domain-containing protein [Rhodocyclaceae bacterium]|nr:DUF2163 domain-containing protein [Rhodocyclaceae bacterium]
MSYQGIENTTAQGRPVELYEFALGATRWRYTTASSAVSYLNQSYEPAIITRGGIEQSEELNRANLSIRVFRDFPVAALFVAQPPDGVLSVSIYRQHLTDPAAEWIVLWKGRVVGCRFSGSEAELACEPVATSLKRTGLRARYSLLCRHALYSAACGASKELLRVDGIVGSVGGKVALVPAAASRPDGYFTAGMLQTNEGARMIVGHTGSTLTLAAPFPGLSVGASVRLYPGCQHTTADCSGKFGNIINFGGFPAIPSKNPFSGDAVM